MKKISTVIICLVFSIQSHAQHIVSIDLASIRNVRTPINGLNVSSFYHFNKQLVGGLEVNRFFPITRRSEAEEISISAWDIEVNFHYLVEIHKGLSLYPITGVSHTTDKEMNIANKESSHISFWSLNTGGGILWELGHWSPHIEYSFAWGQHNQQFLLAGLTYEIELGHHHNCR
jgi:hypothetical protein